MDWEKIKNEFTASKEELQEELDSMARLLLLKLALKSENDFLKKNAIIKDTPAQVNIEQIVWLAQIVKSFLIILEPEVKNRNSKLADMTKKYADAYADIMEILEKNDESIRESRTILLKINMSPE